MQWSTNGLLNRKVKIKIMKMQEWARLAITGKKPEAIIVLRKHNPKLTLKEAQLFIEGYIEGTFPYEKKAQTSPPLIVDPPACKEPVDCMDLHILPDLMGRFIFSGNIPTWLGELRLATKEDIVAGRACKDATGFTKALKFPSFKTPLDAFMFAKQKGYIIASYVAATTADKFYLSASICRDDVTGELYNPLDDKERQGYVERVPPEVAKMIFDAGVGDMVFYSVYETGLDSMSVLIDDFKTEAEAEACRKKLYKRLD